MNSGKTRSRIKNFMKIKDIIEISKLDTINKLQNAQKIAKTHFEMSMVAKQMLDFAYKKYWIRRPLFKNKKSKGITWIFGTLSSSLLDTPYTEQEEIILKNFNKDLDYIIAIGTPAIEFAKKNNFDILYEEKNIEIAIKEAPSIIASLFIGGQSQKINFVSNSQYISDKPLTILPIHELDIDFKHKHHFSKKYKFYPSLDIALENVFKTYIQRITEALLRETKYFYFKQKLIKHEESIKSVDEKIDHTKRKLSKVNRKIETEEIILVTQIAQGGNRE